MEFNNKQLQNITLKIINHIGYKCQHFSQLHNLIIDRNYIISNNNYNNVLYLIPNIKKIISSSNFNSLHINAQKKQKWPLLNLFRQLLKIQNFNLKPIRKSAGKDKNGKKMYKRFFIIEKIASVVDADFQDTVFTLDVSDGLQEIDESDDTNYKEVAENLKTVII